MCSYKFVPYEVDFSDCGQITKFPFYFFASKIRQSYIRPWVPTYGACDSDVYYSKSVRIAWIIEGIETTHALIDGME